MSGENNALYMGVFMRVAKPCKNYKINKGNDYGYKQKM